MDPEALASQLPDILVLIKQDNGGKLPTTMKARAEAFIKCKGAELQAEWVLYQGLVPREKTVDASTSDETKTIAANKRKAAELEEDADDLEEIGRVTVPSKKSKTKAETRQATPTVSADPPSLLEDSEKAKRYKHGWDGQDPMELDIP